MLFPLNQKGRIWTSTECFDFQAEPIGSGALSRVYAVKEKSSGKEYAVKVLSLRTLAPEDQRNVKRELEAYRVLRHPAILRYYDHIIENAMIYIVLELVHGGNLYAYLRSGAQHAHHTVRRFYRQCVEVVDHIHRQGFLVRDIKPENFLLDERLNVRICDFGWTCRANDTEACFEIAGTYSYMSPEALLGMHQTPASDIWSLGVLLYELYYQREPFSGSSAKQMLELLTNHRLEFPPSGVAIPEAAIDLIKATLKMAPRNRLCMSALKAHRFFGPARSIAEWEKVARSPVSRTMSADVRYRAIGQPEAESSSRKQSALTAATRSSSDSLKTPDRAVGKRRIVRLCSHNEGADWLDMAFLS